VTSSESWISRRASTVITLPVTVAPRSLTDE
jgi:hypothetical protein